MKFSSLTVLLIVALVSSSTATNPLPNEEWETGTVDLGNGGDRMFYLLIKCKECRLRQPATVPPLMMWLHGGPGGPSIEACFLGVCPMVFNMSYQFESNQFTWVKHADIMFVDNPVGVPYSIAKDKTTLCRDERCVARNLYLLMIKFVEERPEYRGRPFYLAGESYAGHYIPAFGAYLTKVNNPYINFVGAGIGNGWMDASIQNPVTPDFLLSTNNISSLGYLAYKTMAIVCDSAMVFNVQALTYLCTNFAFVLGNLVGIDTPYDITRKKVSPEFFKRFNAFFNSTDTKKAFNVEDRNYDPDTSGVYEAMLGDIPTSVRDDISTVLNNGRKLIFWFGDKDLVCHWMGGFKVLTSLIWKESEAYKNAPENEWKGKDGKVYGTTKRYSKLTYIKVHDAGHMILQRQKQAGLEILSELINQ